MGQVCWLAINIVDQMVAPVWWVGVREAEAMKENLMTKTTHVVSIDFTDGKNATTLVRTIRALRKEYARIRSIKKGVVNINRRLTLEMKISELVTQGFNESSARVEN